VSENTYVLRTCDRNMKSHGGFQWPDSGEVSAPDWKANNECGNGLHGWLLGNGDWSLRSQDHQAWWLVVEVEASEVIELNGKVKFPRGNVIGKYKNWPEALAFIDGRVGVVPESYASGNSGHASASGNSGHASASGNSGHASASGNYGHASASGYSGHASASGDSGCSFTGFGGKAKSTGTGSFAICWHDGKRARITVGVPGENGIKPDTWYRCDDKGNLIEATN